MRSRWLMLACLGVALPARAEQPDWVEAHLELERDAGAEGCIDREGLEQAIETRLRRPVFAARAEADVVVEAELRRVGTSWEAEIGLYDREGRKLGTRVLATEAEHCSSLDDSLALALALMLDVPTDELPSPEPSETQPPAAPGVKAPPPTTLVRLPEDTAARREPWGYEVGLFGTAALGMLPGLSPGLRLSGGIEPPRFWQFEVESTLWPSQEVDEAGGGVRVGAWAFGLFVCPLRWKDEPWSASACVGQQVGWYSAEGFGYDLVEQRSPPLYALGLRSRAAINVWGPLALRAGLGVEAPLVRDRFVYLRADGTRTGLFRAAPVGGVAELGFGLVP